MREFAGGHDGPIDEAAVLRDPDGPYDDDDTIDQVLRLVADHHRALGSLIGRRSFSPTLAELRQSPLGRDLRVLANGGRGEASPRAVEAAAARVAEVLLRPLAADDFRLPAWFWTTAVGRMLARAERTIRGAGAFLSLAQAAERLEVDRRTLEGWIADGALATIPDEQGRPLLLRDDIERRRAIRLEFAVQELDRGEDVVLTERRLAS